LYSSTFSVWLQSGLGSVGAQLGLVGSWAQLLRAGIVIGLMAIVIRLMDDFLDSWVDELQGVWTVGAALGKAALPYSLALFAASATLHSKLAIALFFAAYGIGMVGDLDRQLPTGLNGKHEALLTLALGVLGQGITVMAWAYALMLAFQCSDDSFDYHQDLSIGQRNLCQRIGRVETMILAACAFTLCLLLSPLLTLSALLAVGVVHILLPHTSMEQERQVL
jgi:hypothetical protein